MLESNITALCFDFGLRKIGIAIGQTITGSAKPLAVINARGGEPTDWQLVDKLVNEWLPDILIVGLPLELDASSDKPEKGRKLTPQEIIVQHVKIFAKQLEARYTKKVELFDERLSTVEARSRVFDQGGYKALQKKRLDGVAAQIILESWLAERGRL